MSKAPCKTCGSKEWTRMKGSVEGDKVIERCNDCPPPTDKDVINVPFLGAGAKNKTPLTMADYEAACEKANKTGKDIYL